MVKVDGVGRVCRLGAEAGSSVVLLVATCEGLFFSGLVTLRWADM